MNSTRQPWHRLYQRDFGRWNGISVTRTQRGSSEAKITYVKLNNQMPCPPRGTVPVNQGCRSEALSLHDIRIAFGNGCDRSNYVATHFARLIELVLVGHGGEAFQKIFEVFGSLARRAQFCY